MTFQEEWIQPIRKEEKVWAVTRRVFAMGIALFVAAVLTGLLGALIWPEDQHGPPSPRLFLLFGVCCLVAIVFFTRIERLYERRLDRVGGRELALIPEGVQISTTLLRSGFRDISLGWLGSKYLVKLSGDEFLLIPYGQIMEVAYARDPSIKVAHHYYSMLVITTQEKTIRIPTYRFLGPPDALLRELQLRGVRTATHSKLGWVA